MNRRLSSLLQRRAIVWLATTACCSICLAPLARAEVTPVPPGSTAGLQPGQQPTTPPVPVPATPKPATNPAPNKPAAIPTTLKTVTALAPAQSATIKTYVSTNFARLLSDENNAVDSARAELVAGMSSPAPKTPCSFAYLTDYTNAVVAELQKVVDKAPLPKRVNAAIVVARVAEQIHAQGDIVALTPLYPFIMAEMKDKCEAIALWGVKAATQAMAAAPGAPTLQMMAAIIPCVKDHNLSGAITDEAYTALDIPSQPAAIKATLDLYKLRVDAFANGVPSDPSVDWRAASHLTAQTGMWPKLTPQQQDQVMGLIRANMEGALANLKPDASPELQDQTKTVLIKEGGAVWVVASAKAISELTIQSSRLSKMSPNASPDQMSDAAKPVISGIQQAFPGSGGAVGGNGNAAVAKP